jgi:hypothetical protein
VPFTNDQAKARIKAFGRGRAEATLEVAAEGEPDQFAGSLLLAIGLRESGLTNIVGDAGHGRGAFQIDDRSHQAFLSQHAGCESGKWVPVHGIAEGGALPGGRVPGFVAAVQYALRLLKGNAAFALANGVAPSHVKQFAVAAYNCGAGNALRSYREGGIRNIDRRTAHGNYSKDVLENQSVVNEVLRGLNWV